jgi:acetylornithine deacetylase
MLDRTIELLAQLVAFDTTSRNSNLALIEFVEDYLARFGVPSIRVDHEPGKTNLYATIGPDIAGGIVLSGHTDVVPVDGQPWTTNPFELTEKDGKLYARGSADMKGFLACCLAMVPEYVKAPLSRPIHLAFSCDEEVGCRGVRPLIAHMRDHLPKPMAVIVGEPTLMKVVNAHKASHTYETSVTGCAAHSSNAHQGVNAIMYAGELLAELNRMAKELQARGDKSGRFVPPYSTLQVGLIEGGTAKNIVAQDCNFAWDMRLLPDADPDEMPQRLEAFAESLLPQMQAVSKAAQISTTRMNIVPGLAPDEDSAAEAIGRALTGANALAAVSYATEAGLFQQAGIPAIICGPGSIDQAHKADEWIETSELAACLDFLRKLTSHALS